MSASHRAALAAAFLLAIPAVADELPDMAMLEYLGSWEDSDADWELLTEELDELSADTDETRRDPVAGAEESLENDHES